MNPRAPKQWSLTKQETITSFEAWRQNLQYILSLDRNFAGFLADGVTWLKKSPGSPGRGLQDDPESVPQASRRTAQQKCTHLELMLGQIANYCPVISRNTIVKNSTSMNSIWQAIRLHFGFQSTGAHFLDFNNITLAPAERPEDLYQRLMSFIEDNLLLANGSISHHGEVPGADEDMSPTLENLVVLTWLRLVHPELPNLVKQRYGTELRSKSLATLKPEISQALDSLLEEINSNADAKILRSTASKFRQPPLRGSYNRFQKASTKPQVKSCPLCKQAGRNDRHFLSQCTYLPAEDRAFLAKARLASCIDDEDDPTDSDFFCSPDVEDFASSPHSSARVVSRRVSTKQSPNFNAFYRHHSLKLTLDTGAETSMIKASVARSIDAPIVKSSQQALQADGVTPLVVVGETHLTLSRAGTCLTLDALVVEDLDVDVLAGTPFMITNDISVRPAKGQVLIQGSEILAYHPESSASSQAHAVRRTQSYVLRSSSPTTVVLPGEYLELSLPPTMDPDCTLAIESRTDAPSNKYSKGSQLWPQPQIVDAVASRVRLVNDTAEPRTVRRHEHLCQARHTTAAVPTSPVGPHPPPSHPGGSCSPQSGFFSDAVVIDPDNILPDTFRNKFREMLQTHDAVFNPEIVGYNGMAGPVQASVNMGPVQPPQRKGRVPQYSRDKLVELQQKFDELEQCQVFRRPEDIGVTVEYLNPSFLVKKPSGGFRLVTAFTDVGRYSKPQPSLMPDVDSTLRTIAPWKYIIKSDLTRAFYQIPLSKASMKYCGVATPFRGIRVYTRSAMGMPGSETALEELMCRVLGDFLQEGCATKLADDLYCGGDTPQELIANWSRILDALARCNLRLSATKTVICPKTTTILGWIWSQGSLSASPHRIAALATCLPPESVKGMRSFIGAYKVLSRVLPHCAQLVDPLESSLADLQSHDHIQWNDNLRQKFSAAQDALNTHKSIVLPRPSDQLWIVTDGSVTRRGLGATLYVTRQDRLLLAGFYSSKLRKHQVTWLPCEVEALSIAAAVKHFSPFIIQSTNRACVLTDSQPCVQALQKLCRGEFSASPRVTSFLTTVSRYQVSLQHLAGAANLPSDFASRNAPDCTEPNCQICSFVHESESSVVRGISAQEVLDNTKRLPFTNRPAWFSVQNECPDLRRVCAHLKQGTRPSKKLTNIRDVKRYLNVTSISKDGLLIVQRQQPLSRPIELIVVPRSALDGLLTAIHLKLDHPSKHQLQMVIQRHFFALDMSAAIARVSDSCHTCASLKKFPTSLTSQSSEDPPEVVGVSFAADIIRRCRQFILLLRECTTSYTASCLVPDEKSDTLRDALAQLVVGLHPLDGPPAVIRVDPAPGFVSLKNFNALQHLGISVEVGRIKNTNKNPVAERAVLELEEELLRQEPGGGPVTELSLAIATARLNSRLRSQGLSSRELWTQRNQFSNEQIPINDLQHILAKQKARQANHPFSEAAKGGYRPRAPVPPLQVGDLVYIKSDRDKSRARDRYIIVSIDGEWCFIKKFSGSQLRATSYKVKLVECYAVPHTLPTPSYQSVVPLDDDECEEIAEQPQPGQQPSAPPDLLRPPSPDPSASTPHHTERQDDTSSSATDPIPIPVPSQPRPQRARRPPAYLQEYILD